MDRDRALYRLIVWSSLFCMMPWTFLMAATFPYKSNPSEVRVIPVEPTPEANTVVVQIVFPEKSEIKMREPVRLQLKISGFPLRTNSDFPRMKEISNDPAGQSIIVIIDENQIFYVNDANVETLDSRENYYTQIAEVAIPFDLSSGEHIVRAFPLRSFNESLKQKETFAVERFYFQSRTKTIDQDLEAPFITYSEPLGTFDYSSNQPILLDFIVTNTELSSDGYKVELTIDGKIKRLLTSWVPYYLYGLKPGTHVIRLRLLDPKNRPVKGVFNNVQRTIKVLQ